MVAVGAVFNQVYVYMVHTHILLTTVFDFILIIVQKQEEILTGNIINPADITGDIIVKFVTNAVTAIMTRLQSKLLYYLDKCRVTYDYCIY